MSNILNKLVGKSADADRNDKDSSNTAGDNKLGEDIRDVVTGLGGSQNESTPSNQHYGNTSSPAYHTHTHEIYDDFSQATRQNYQSGEMLDHESSVSRDHGQGYPMHGEGQAVEINPYSRINEDEHAQAAEEVFEEVRYRPVDPSHLYQNHDRVHPFEPVGPEVEDLNADSGHAEGNGAAYASESTGLPGYEQGRVSGQVSSESEQRSNRGRMDRAHSDKDESAEYEGNFKTDIAGRSRDQA